ncbi:MtN3-like protein [Phytophthora cinnamomi]|uniref:MtN3-like protein n=1 Tax=Phytophthora cinnamomi TaxID=4785 RepID=UPI00355956AE|nr:MtN3-like protein [Phytophthora cinnamomi]
MALAFELLRVLATASSVVLYVSPWPEFRRIRQRGSPGETSLLPVVMLFCNAFMWCVYGCVADSIFPLVVVNAFGVATSVFFSAVYVRCSSAAQRRYARQLWLGAGLAMTAATAYAAAGVRGATNQLPTDVAASLGVVCVTANICLFASPLETMGQVVRSKSAASLPIALCVANLVSGALWSTLAIAQRDMFVLAPNALGTALSLAQVALYLAYPPPPEGVRRPEHSRPLPLPVIMTASKNDEVSVKVAVQGPVFLPEATSLTPLVAGRGEVRPLLPITYGSKSVQVTAA